ncbi:MAG: amino acid permease [Bacteroidetes bacterium]|nr:amino acid permease [Bacteroidota bacterium]MBS1628937.1 amino acid permease [Bacteroidota bacterium]
MEQASPHYHRSLRLIDGALLVAGSMIGSGIFIVSADISRTLGSAGWLIVVWIISGLLTLAAALSYGELSGMFPKAGGQYVYLREAYGPMWSFLYGWAFFTVIQTGTIAAVGVAFAKFFGYLAPALGEDNILATIGSFHLTAAQLVGIGVIVLLTAINGRGIEGGKWINGIFTAAKLLAMAALIAAGFILFRDGAAIWKMNWSEAWMAIKIDKGPGGTIFHEMLQGGPLVLALCGAMVGAIFSSDAWNNVTFIAGEIKRPERNIGLSLFLGTLVVTLLYICMNLMYLNVLSVHEIAFSQQDRVALAASKKLFGALGTTIIAVLVMVSTFGCNNGLILAGARVYNTMARDGLFLPAAAKLNAKGVPAIALWMQCLWASILCLSGKYGQLLDYIVFVVLIFYILTIGGIFVLRRRRPDLPRPYKAFGYPVVPVLYMMVAAFICIILLKVKPDTTLPGLFIVLLGIPVYFVVKASIGKRIKPD